MLLHAAVALLNREVPVNRSDFGQYMHGVMCNFRQPLIYWTLWSCNSHCKIRVWPKLPACWPK